MKLAKEEKQRIAEGDMRFFKTILLKELEIVQKDLMIFKESKGYDDVLKGKGSFIQELLKVLEV